MANLWDLNLRELLAELEKKNVSASEVQTTFLTRATQDPYNAFLHVSAKAKTTPNEGSPLKGVPVAIKDVLTIKGQPTTCGSKILSDYKPPFTATAVSRLTEQGAFALGKTNMDEFAMGSSNENSAFGAVKNPWDISRVPGGSSGGSAAAVAGRLCPAALGSDTGGSVRQPASFCGIVGLKPTYGRISRYGLIAFASSLDQVGVFSRTTEDAALLLQILAGDDPLDGTSMKRPKKELDFSARKDLSGLRIGVPKEYFTASVHPDVSTSVQQALETLSRDGAELVDISLPSTELAVATYYILAPAEASSNLARFDGIRYGKRAENVETLQELYLRSRSEGFGTEVKRRILVGSYVLSAGYYDAYYLRAQKMRRVITEEFAQVFSQDCDLIACPTTPSTAFSLGEKIDDPLQMYMNDVFTVPASLAGLPAISLPCGFDTQDLPVGLQFIGRPWDEKTIIQTAVRYEALTDWHHRVPKGIENRGET